MMKINKRGFTLIELLVVIAIIGILASIVLASLNTARKKGRDARRIADVKQLQLALELYSDGNSGAYPTAAAGSVASTLTALTTGGMIASLPADPGTGTYTYASTDGAASPTACTTGTCAGYVLRADLETAAATTTYNGAVASCSSAAGSGFVARYCVRN